jgi:hypothetical protein
LERATKNNKTAITFSDFFSTVKNHRLAILIMFICSKQSHLFHAIKRQRPQLHVQVDGPQDKINDEAGIADRIQCDYYHQKLELEFFSNGRLTLTADFFFVVFCCARQSENPDLGTRLPEHERHPPFWEQRQRCAALTSLGIVLQNFGIFSNLHCPCKLKLKCVFWGHISSAQSNTTSKSS